MRRVTRWAGMAGVVMATFVASAVHAQHVTLGTFLSESQEVPRSLSPATGFTNLTYNQALGTISVGIGVQGLTGQTVGVGPGGAPAHIHFAPPGVNGSIVLPIVGAPVGALNFNFSATYTFAQLLGFGVSAANVLTLQTQLNSLVNAPLGTVANLYSNVHTSAFPGGEIRGDLAVVPEPSTYAPMATALGILGVLRRRRLRA